MSALRKRWLAPAALSLLLCVGCDAGDECRFGAECASGICHPDGTCGSLVDAGVSLDATTPADAGAEADAGPTPDAGSPDAAMSDAGSLDAGRDASAPACGDGDDRLSADELPLPLDVAVTRRVAMDVTVDTHGTERFDATRLWDFEGPYDGDADVAFVRTSPVGTWFASSFPTATYALPLSADEDLIGVFRASPDALVLLGVVSSDGGATRTELTYDPPAPIWQLPLEHGATWNETSNVTGVTQGVPSVYSERWIVQIDARGDAGTPAGVRPVLRVNTRITRTVGVLITDTRRHSYVEPCVGTIAQVFGVGTDEEPSFASEIWRVAP